MKEKLLIIDDDENFLLSMKFNLHHVFDIITLSKPKEALKVINDNDIYCLIVDYDMPEINGIDLTKLIRNNPKICNIPIIMFTGYDDPKVKQLIKDNNLNAYFLKTNEIDYNFIVTQIQSIVNLHKLNIGFKNG